MSSRCSGADVFDRKASDIEIMLDMDHIAVCAECAELLEGHRKLEQAFQGTTRNVPSIHFNQELKHRLQDEQLYEHHVQRRTMVLRTYWLLVTIASLIILWLVPWPGQMSSTPVVASIS